MPQTVGVLLHDLHLLSTKPFNVSFRLHLGYQIQEQQWANIETWRFVVWFCNENIANPDKMKSNF